MRPVSATFLDALTASHKIVCRATVVNNNPFGLTPTGTVIPIIEGDVRLTERGDVKSTLDMTTSADYWDLLQPYGAEVFIERGIDYGAGAREFVGLGYFRVERVEQDRAPLGPIRITGKDRTAQLMQNRVLFPYQFPAGRTHAQAFSRLVNGDDGAGQSTQGYGMFLYIPVPISFVAYVGSSKVVPTGAIVQDSTYDFLAELAAGQDAVLRFNASGQLEIISTKVVSSASVYTIGSGHLGTLIEAKRSTSREHVYNIVSAYGSDPVNPTNYSIAYNDGPSGVQWAGGFASGPWFGPCPRYYASPLLKTQTQCDTAAQSILERYTGLPRTLSVFSVPNPALEPLDVITVRLNLSSSETHVISDVTIPLTANGYVEINTRTLNTVEEGT